MTKITILLFIVFTSVLFVNCKNNETQMKKIEVSDTVPSFKLKDQDGKVFEVNNTIGKPMVIYFYPKDDTPGCTKEACKFRDDFELFSDLEALVIGISADSVESHKKFEQKYNLPFILLADTKNEVRQLFGVPKSIFILPGRVTYIIDEKGIVKYVFNSQFNAEKHIEIALQKLKEF